MAIGATEKERKKFFFEKKNQKTFPSFAARLRHGLKCGTGRGLSCEAPGRSFLVLFFKKEHFSFARLALSQNKPAAFIVLPSASR
jgi:hypothetical protein